MFASHLNFWSNFIFSAEKMIGDTQKKGLV